jgi:hypothetical protein
MDYPIDDDDSEDYPPDDDDTEDDDSECTCDATAFMSIKALKDMVQELAEELRANDPFTVRLLRRIN